MRLVVGLLLLALAGCLPRAETPRESVNLVIVDKRTKVQGDPPAFIGGLELYSPLVPWTSGGTGHFPFHSLHPQLRTALEASNLFETVLGPGDRYLDRDAATYQLEVELRETTVGSIRTAYALSLAGVVLHLLGAPVEYQTFYVELHATCRDRDGRVVAEGLGSEREFGFSVIYELLDEGINENVEDCVRAALSEALEPLFDD